MPLGPPAGSRIAVVGGAGGIGRAVVGRLLAGGARVAVLDLPQSLARHRQPAALEHAVDATDADALLAGFAAVGAAFGALDGLVCLAGFAAARTPLAETPAETFHDVLDGSLATTFLSCRAALPLLRRGEAAAIVTMASGLAARATAGYGAYAAAKAGVLALTRQLAAEEAPRIRANAVAPSAVDTEFLRGGTHRADIGTGAPRFDREAYLRTVPLGRMAAPDDIAGPILFLLGPASAYITGQALHINGGLVTP